MVCTPQFEVYITRTEVKGVVRLLYQNLASEKSGWIRI